MLNHPIIFSHKNHILLLIIALCAIQVCAQCPSIINTNQSFCDLDGPTISDLVAIDEGNGVFWYDTATSTAPIENLDSLVSGEDYYADDASGTCGSRERVDVLIYGAPIGLNFQGVCVDDLNDATISDLNATGNNVQWYSAPVGGANLAPTTILSDNTLYYADQENPDTGCRTSRLSVLINIGFVPVPTGNPIQEFCSDELPTIADLAANGVNNWYANSGSVIPLDPFEPLVNGANYFATSVDPPCESDNRLEVTVVINTPANSGTSGFLDICETEVNTTMTIDLIDSLLGSPETDGSWSGPFPTANGSIGTVDITSMTANGGPYIFTYTVDSETICGTNSSTVTITIIEASDAGFNGAIDLCTNNNPIDLFTIISGTPETGGTWNPNLSSGTGLFDPAIDTAGIYTYTIFGNEPCQDASSTVTVTTTIPPNPGTNATVDLCTNNDAIDLFTVLGGAPETGGTWSPNLSSGTGLFDPALDPTGIYTYTLTGTSPCDDQFATVTVDFIPQSNAGTDGVLDLCTNNNPIDLFTSLGGSPETGGIWTPTLTSGTGLFDPALDTAGVYTYTITANPPCEDSSATVTVTTSIPANPGINANVDLCTNNDPVDLFTVLGGSPETGGTWSPELTSGTGLFDPASDPTGIYTYTLIGTSPCDDQSATVTVDFIATPNAGTNGTIDLCEDNVPIDLFTSLGGSPETGGIWTPTLTSGTGLFDPALDTAGVYTYTIAANPPCEDSSATVTVTTSIPANPGTNATIDLCANNDPVDLFTVLGGSPETGGTWSPELTSGTGLFDPASDPTGIYTYTLIGTPPCDDQSATVTVDFVPTPNAGTDGIIDLCTNNNPIDLFTILGGSPETEGIWTPTLTSGTGLFDPALDTAGVYTYTITANPPCEDSSATVTVTTSIPPNPGTNATIDLCTNNDPVDLFNVLGGSPETGGTWSPALTSGTGLFDPASDPTGIYTYTLIGTPPCDDQSATVTVDFIPTPNAGTNGTIDLCEDNVPIDLFTSLGGSPETGGIWTPTLTSGTGLFDPALDTAGVYTYTIAANPPCEDSSATVTVTTSIPANPGTNATIDLCANNDPVDLFTVLGGSPETGGTWSPALTSGTGLFDPASDPTGIYTYTLIGTPPCDDQSATVTVDFIPTPNAGTNGTIDLCEDNVPIDLFTSLGGSPETGGIWTPTLTSGTGLFDPALDTAGVYTYTIAANPPCEDSSATVTVTTSIPPNPGTNATIDLCANNDPVDLFTVLGGSPETGGTWSPALTSGTGLFDPASDPTGIYTYTLIGTPPCDDQSATVTVDFVPTPNAGTDGIIDLCTNNNPIDLFTILGGSPETEGIWTPTLTSGTGLFDPALDTAGVYTYTITANPPCEDSSATVTVTTSIPANPGTNATIDLCANNDPVDLFTVLGGSPETGGTWSPALTSGTGLFDPASDPTGIYTYTLIGTPPCDDQSATVTVDFIPQPNAGEDSNAVICNADGPQDLFNFIAGSPDSGGTWSPALFSGTGVFDPIIDIAGTYSYTVTGPVICNDSDTSTVTITIEVNPDATGLEIVSTDICLGLPNDISITNALLLTDGSYTLSYNISGANQSDNTVTIEVLNGASVFTIPANLLTNTGLTTITITSITNIDSICSADVSAILTSSFIVLNSVTPEIIDNGAIFCLQDEPTIENLSSNITSTENITWFDAPTNGNSLENPDPLVDGQTYYASALSDDGCESTTRLEVTVLFEDCPEDIVIPDGFSPNDDSINDTFTIENIRDLYPNFTLEIYNRYGNILYKGDTNTPDWDGTSEKGITLGDSRLPVGVYFFVLEFNDNNKNPIQGRVYLSR